METTYYCNRCSESSPLEEMLENLSICTKCYEQEQGFKKDDTVLFQAYKDHQPLEARIKRIGTLAELGRIQLDPNDTRIFYELVSLGKSSFTVTTARWIKK